MLSKNPLKKMVLLKMRQFGNRFKRKGPIDWNKHNVWLETNAIPRKIQESLTSYFESKTINWRTHNAWLDINAPHRPNREPPTNPIGPFNQNCCIGRQRLHDFYKNQAKRHQFHCVEEEPPFIGPFKSDLKINKKRFCNWYKRAGKCRKIIKLKPIKRQKKPLDKLKPTICRLAKPKKYVIPPKKVAYVITRNALHFQPTEFHKRMATPKKRNEPIKTKLHPYQPLSTEGWLHLTILSKPTCTIAVPVRRRPPQKNYYPIKEAALKYIPSMRILEISKPNHKPVCIFKNRPKPEPLVSRNALQYTPSARIMEISKHAGEAQIIFKHRPPESIHTPVKPAALKYNITPRVEQLAIPLGEIETIFKNRPTTPTFLKKSILTYTATPRIEELARPRTPIKIYYKNRSESQTDLDTAILTHKASSRLTHLSRPRTPVKKFKDQPKRKAKGLPQAVLEHKASSRTMSLAQPRPPLAKKLKDRPKPVEEKVSRAAMKYEATDRISNLSRPRTPVSVKVKAGAVKAQASGTVKAAALEYIPSARIEQLSVPKPPIAKKAKNRPPGRDGPESRPESAGKF